MITIYLYSKNKNNTEELSFAGLKFNNTVTVNQSVVSDHLIRNVITSIPFVNIMGEFEIVTDEVSVLGRAQSNTISMSLKDRMTVKTFAPLAFYSLSKFEEAHTKFLNQLSDKLRSNGCQL